MFDANARFALCTLLMTSRPKDTLQHRVVFLPANSDAAKCCALEMQLFEETPAVGACDDGQGSAAPTAVVVVDLDSFASEAKAKEASRAAAPGAPLVGIGRRTDSVRLLNADNEGFLDYLQWPVSAAALLSRAFSASRKAKALAPVLGGFPGPERATHNLGAWLWMGQAASTIMSGATHDLNNLLTEILGYLELAVDDYPKPEALEDLKTAQTSARLAARMIGDIRSLARPLQFDALSASWVFAYALQPVLVKMLSVPSQIDVTVESSQVHFAFCIPRILLRHLIHPLVMNSAEAIESAPNNVKRLGEQPSIHVCVSTADDHALVIEVVDTGPGWSENPIDMRRAFISGERLDSTKGRNRGFGLWNVFNITKVFGGELILSTADSGGAKVTLLLPWRIVE